MNPPPARPGRKFAYYRNLSPTQRRIYDKSDAIENISLPDAVSFTGITDALKLSLEEDDISKTQKEVQSLVDHLCKAFDVPCIKAKVLNRRPTRSHREFHGLYEAEEGEKTVLTVWMRTAKRKQTVAFRTFLRTVIHEFLHHLDFTYLGLRDSFHTEGFFKRESSLLKQLLRE